MQTSNYIKRESLELTQPQLVTTARIWPSSFFGIIYDLTIDFLRNVNSSFAACVPCRWKFWLLVAWTDAIVRTCTVQRLITLPRLKGRLKVPTLKPTNYRSWSVRLLAWQTSNRPLFLCVFVCILRRCCVHMVMVFCAHGGGVVCTLFLEVHALRSRCSAVQVEFITSPLYVFFQYRSHRKVTIKYRTLA